MKSSSKTYMQIADTLGRGYWGISYKISQLNSRGKIKPAGINPTGLLEKLPE